jgi:hypothetical protein
MRQIIQQHLICSTTKDNSWPHDHVICLSSWILFIWLYILFNDHVASMSHSIDMRFMNMKIMFSTCICLETSKGLGQSSLCIQAIWKEKMKNKFQCQYVHTWRTHLFYGKVIVLLFFDKISYRIFRSHNTFSITNSCKSPSGKIKFLKLLRTTLAWNIVPFPIFWWKDYWKQKKKESFFPLTFVSLLPL